MNKSFKSSIILSNRIKFKLFQELPILCELMLGFRIVKDAKDLNTGYEIIQSLPISTLLVLKSQLINLTQRKRLLFNQFNDFFTNIFLAINHIWINRWPSFFTHLVKFSLLNTFQSLFIYACDKMTYSLYKLKILWHKLISRWTVCVRKVKYFYEFIDNLSGKCWVKFILLN